MLLNATYPRRTTRRPSNRSSERDVLTDLAPKGWLRALSSPPSLASSRARRARGDGLIQWPFRSGAIEGSFRGNSGDSRERAIRTVRDRCNAATVAQEWQRSTSDAESVRLVVTARQRSATRCPKGRNTPAPLVRYVRVGRNARRLNQRSSAGARRPPGEGAAHSYRARGGLCVCGRSAARDHRPPREPLDRGRDQTHRAR